MRSLGRRVLVGLGVIAAAVMSIGYAFIFSGLATPPGGDRAVLDVPPAGEVRPARLDDGTPVYVVHRDGAVSVIDARGRATPGELAGMVAWCTESQGFIDLVAGTIFGPDGAVLGGPADGGLSVLVSRPGEGVGRVIVGAEAADAGSSPRGSTSLACPPRSMIVHRPDRDEMFDPSVATDQEPPGWIWVAGTLSAVDSAVRLCDGSGSACEGSAEVRGIDPARLEASHGGRVEGQFIGRVRDGALEGLILVPDVGDDS